MGANMIMKAAGMHGKDFPLRAIAAVNNPFDLWLSINLMRGTKFEKHLANELKRQLICRKDEEMSEVERL